MTQEKGTGLASSGMELARQFSIRQQGPGSYGRQDSTPVSAEDEPPEKEAWHDGSMGISGLLNGRLVEVKTPDGVLRAVSPSDLDDVVGELPFAHALVGEAVAAARRAQPAWDRLDVSGRAPFLARLRGLLVEREEEVGLLIAREMGKPLREGRQEARAMVAKIDISLGEGLALVQDVELDGGKLAWRYRPHGVLAVIGPFNFPLHLAHGHVVPALLAGNTVVFKPSEVTPHCGLLYARLLAEAGFPPGVVNVVQGDSAVGAALVEDEDVDGVLFTGSYEVGVKILQANATRPGKMLALELGGKNAAIVLADAPEDKALVDVLLSAFSTAGQRCTCASRLIVERSIANPFVERLATQAEQLVVGHALDPAAFLGPLATARGLEKFEAMQVEAEREGSRCIRPPKVPDVRWQGRSVRGYYATPRVRRVEEIRARSPYQRQEIFGPDLAVYVADDLDHAITLANDTPFGLSAGVWTRSSERFEECARRLRVGCLTWNTPTVGSSSRLPF
ncbi:MAG: aldehyde dehydrogenase family protein, partial [Myxococcales bacterium]|nr:aldehyde dehydrogenase family protein [Polyangiaceae bacterium]MDW8251649.1 aldehyde dehydrogenase family protein [Myxococcales bacterium]